MTQAATLSSSGSAHSASRTMSHAGQAFGGAQQPAPVDPFLIGFAAAASAVGRGGSAAHLIDHFGLFANEGVRRVGASLPGKSRVLSKLVGLTLRQ